jgi:hypothetical protein
MLKNKYLFYLFIFFYLIIFIFTKAVYSACSNKKPTQRPDLFQIDATKNSATLYFTPVNDEITQYTIIYGYAKDDQRFGISFPYGKSEGVIKYTINYLSPNMEYYFRVRPDNGCRQGLYSNTMSIKTNFDFKSYYRYKNANKTTKNSNPISKKENIFLKNQLYGQKLAHSGINLKDENMNKVLGIKTELKETAKNKTFRSFITLSIFTILPLLVIFLLKIKESIENKDYPI